jgi:hypothetical protein
MKSYRIAMTFTEPVLGSQPNREVTTDYIHAAAIKKNPELAENGNLEQELETLPEQLEKGTTVFHKVEGRPVFWDYQVRGFLKEWALALNGDKSVGGVKNLRSKIDNFVYVTPRFIPLEMPDGGCITFNERPLRAMTMQGPRVSLARSEQVPAGTRVECVLHIVKEGEITGALLGTLLDMGRWKGLGQWRNGSWGRFDYTMEEVG